MTTAQPFQSKRVHGTSVHKAHELRVQWSVDVARLFPGCDACGPVECRESPFDMVGPCWALFGQRSGLVAVRNRFRFHSQVLDWTQGPI